MDIRVRLSYRNRVHYLSYLIEKSLNFIWFLTLKLLHSTNVYWFYKKKYDFKLKSNESSKTIISYGAFIYQCLHLILKGFTFTLFQRVLYLHRLRKRWLMQMHMIAYHIFTHYKCTSYIYKPFFNKLIFSVFRAETKYVRRLYWKLLSIEQTLSSHVL